MIIDRHSKPQIHENIFLQAMSVDDNDNEDDDGDTGLMAGMLCATGTVLLIIITLIIRYRRKLKRQYKKENAYELWRLGSQIYKATSTKI